MNENTALTPLRLAILGLVDMHPQSGYGLKKVFETTPMGNFSSSPGAIYPALKNFADRGWISGTPENAETLRPRLVYSITGEGEQVLKAELERPVTHEDLIWHFDLVMLRFAFIEKLGHAQALRFLREFRSEAAAYVRYLEGLRESMREQMTPCGQLALEHGIQGSAGNVRWAGKAIEELSRLLGSEESNHD
jgi:DNA-binding PadR family transcriptional regulator